MSGRTKSAVDAELDFDGLLTLGGFQVGMVHSIVSTQLEARLKPMGLSPKLASVLWLAAANPGIQQVTLTRVFRVNRATINAFVRELKAKGLVELEQLEHDKRSLGIVLSAQGRAVLPVMKAAVLQFEDEFAEAVGRDNAALFSQVLENLKNGSPAP